MSIFSKRILTLTKKIPRGKITTYQILSKKAGFPKAYRACGSVLNKNLNLIVVPCHRVVKSDGSIGDFAKGKSFKKKLLEKEGIKIKKDKIIFFEKKLWK